MHGIKLFNKNLPRMDKYRIIHLYLGYSIDSPSDVITNHIDKAPSQIEWEFLSFYKKA